MGEDAQRTLPICGKSDVARRDRRSLAGFTLVTGTNVKSPDPYVTPDQIIEVEDDLPHLSRYRLHHQTRHGC